MEKKLGKIRMGMVGGGEGAFIDDGVRGMAFIETVVKSSQSKQKWIKMPKV